MKAAFGSFLLSLRAAARLFSRPQQLTVPMIALFAIIPGYLVIGAYVSNRTLHSPALALDHIWPLEPGWSLVYLSLFLAALLPVFVVHQQELIRRVVLAYLFIWLLAYVVFLVYPTAAPAHADVIGNGFSAVALRTIYGSDVPYNCFPSLHVAQCFLAAFTCDRVNRGVGFTTGIWASLVALATLFTKQHYVIDVIGGVLLAYIAHRVFLGGYAREATPDQERKLAPLLALAAFGLYGLLAAGLWFMYFVAAT